MQDTFAFFRHQALACFRRRRRWPFLSADWRREVDDARRFIRHCRAEWQDKPEPERAKAAAGILRTAYALGPRVGTQRPRLPPMAAVIVVAPAEPPLPVQAALRDRGFRSGHDGKWRGEIDARRWDAVERELGITLDDNGPWT